MRRSLLEQKPASISLSKDMGVSRDQSATRSHSQSLGKSGAEQTQPKTWVCVRSPFRLVVGDCRGSGNSGPSGLVKKQGIRVWKGTGLQEQTAEKLSSLLFLTPTPSERLNIALLKLKSRSMTRQSRNWKKAEVG